MFLFRVSQNRCNPLIWYFYCMMSSFTWVLKSNRIISKRSNQMTRAEIDWLYPTVHMKNQVLGNVLGGTFSDSFRRNLSPHPHCQDILQPYSSLLVEFVYQPCVLKSVYSTINLTFLGMIVKLNFLRNFTCTILNDFVSKLIVTQNIFSFLIQIVRSSAHDGMIHF